MRSILFSLVAAICLMAGGALSVGSAAAATGMTSSEAEQAARNINSIPADLIGSPRPRAVLRKLPVTLKVHAPAGTTRLSVRLNGRDLSRRFRGGIGVRSAKVNRAGGLRYGINVLAVIAHRGSSRRLNRSEVFYVVRPVRRLANLRLRITDLGVGLTLRATTASLPAGSELGASRAVAKRLVAIHRKRYVKLWLNGHVVNDAIGGSDQTKWVAELSRSHGLRYGENRLRATVTEPETGRYKVMKRRFRVKRNRPLAAAGRDRYLRVGSRVRLNGRRSVAPGHGGLRFHWSIGSKPAGSSAKLVRSGSARPGLKVDQPGDYTVRLDVTGRSGARGWRSGTDRVTLTVGPGSLLVPFTGLATGADIPSGSTPGIEVGDNFYPKPANGQFQWLTLDRATLAPRGANANNWIDKDATGDHSFAGLYDALKGMGHDQLVILTKPLGASGQTAVNPDQVEQFNNILNLLGVASIPADQLTHPGMEFAVVGVPYSQPGSGYSSDALGGPYTLMKGWLMPDAVPAANGDLNFRYQPERIAFNTRAASTPTSNTMEIGGRSLPASLPAGASGGFQVTVINPVTFAVGDSRVFSTNSEGVGGSPLLGRRDMAAYLTSGIESGETLAIQSIGRVGDFSRSDAEEQFAADMHTAWLNLSKLLMKAEANPHIFNTANGSYAFIGGSQLDRTEVTDSSSTVTLDPTTTPPLTEDGAIDGRVAPNGHGIMVPVTASAVDAPDLNLYDKIFTRQSAWPLTGSGPNEAGYAAALAYISAQLNDGNNVRELYWKNPEKTYSDELGQLPKIPYPGTTTTCTGKPATLKGGSVSGSSPNFTRDQFCRMSSQLVVEFRLVDRVKQMFDAYQNAFSRSGPVQQADLQTMAKSIEDALRPDESEEILWSVGGFIENLISTALPFIPGGGHAAFAAWESLVAVYELSSDLSSATGGVPVGEQVESKVGELGVDLSLKLDAASDGIDRLQQVVVSDWGRLQAVGAVAGTPGWSVDVPTVKANLVNAAQVFFSSELMPIPYGVHYLSWTGFNGRPTADNCYTMAYGHTYRGAPDTAKLTWMGPFSFQGVTRDPYPDLPYPAPAPNPMVLAVHSPSALRYSYPPAEITDRMFRPRVQGGFGMQLPRYIWDAYTGSYGGAPAGTAPPTYIAYCH